MFRQLSGFEANHYRKLRTLSESLEAKGEWIAYDGTSLKPGAQPLKAEKLSGPDRLNDLDALKIAIQAEKKAQAYYRSMAELTGDGRGKRDVPAPRRGGGPPRKAPERPVLRPPQHRHLELGRLSRSRVGRIGAGHPAGPDPTGRRGAGRGFGGSCQGTLKGDVRGRKSANPMEEKKFEGKTKITVAIDTIHCADCALNIERSVEHLPGVLSRRGELRPFPRRRSISIPTASKETGSSGPSPSPVTRSGRPWPSGPAPSGGRGGSIVFTSLCGLLLALSWILGWARHRQPRAPGRSCRRRPGAGRVPDRQERLQGPSSSRTLNVDTLVSIAALSAAAGRGLSERRSRWVFIMLLGESLEELTVGKTRSAIASLINLAPKTAWVRRDGPGGPGSDRRGPGRGSRHRQAWREDPRRRIDRGRERRRQRGHADRPSPFPWSGGAGDRIFCGTYNEAGSFEMEVTQVAEDTKLAHIRRLIVEAQAEKSPIQRVMDRFSRYFIPIILGPGAAHLRRDRPGHPGHHHSHRRLPLRPGPGHAHGRGRRHRPGGAAGNPDQGRRLPRADGKAPGPSSSTRRGPSPREGRSWSGSSPSTTARRMKCSTGAAVAEMRSEHPLGMAVTQTAKERGIGVPHPDAFENVRGKGRACPLERPCGGRGRRRDDPGRRGRPRPGPEASRRKRRAGVLGPPGGRGRPSLRCDLPFRCAEEENARAAIDRIRREGRVRDLDAHGRQRGRGPPDGRGARDPV